MYGENKPSTLINDTRVRWTFFRGNSQALNILQPCLYIYIIKYYNYILNQLHIVYICYYRTILLYEDNTILNIIKNILLQLRTAATAGSGSSANRK